MPGQEGHPAAGHLANQDGLARLPERRLDLNLVAVGEELVETRTPDDPDVRDGGHGRQATFSPEEPEEELTDEAFSPPEDGDEAFSPPEDEDDGEDEEDGEDEDGESGEDPAADEEDEACAGADDPFRLSVR
jgi:hypothetical protein